MPYLEDYIEGKIDLSIKDLILNLQRTFCQTSTYFGIRTIKSPLDAWVFQEIIFETKPDVIIEIGTKWGGTTLMLSHWLDLLGRPRDSEGRRKNGKVISIDCNPQVTSPLVLKHPRITLLTGKGEDVIEEVKKLIAPDEVVLVVEDSSHTPENTLNMLRLYSGFVKPGGYFIVEDTICHHGLNSTPENDPYRGVEAFLAENDDFVIDRSREKHILTWNPKGFLKRIK